MWTEVTDDKQTWPKEGVVYVWMKKSVITGQRKFGAGEVFHTNDNTGFRLYGEQAVNPLDSWEVQYREFPVEGLKW